jgi:hypothetical protein
MESLSRRAAGAIQDRLRRMPTCLHAGGPPLIAEYKRNTNIGVGLGVLLNATASGMMRDPDTATMALIVGLGGLGLLIWGCSQYAEGKGHSPWWGALGLFSLLGFLVLVFLPDRCADGERPSTRSVRREDEAFLFPSDARVVTTQPAQRASTTSLKLQFRVRFGSAVSIDEFGFVRAGRVAVEGDRVRFNGPKHWSLAVRAGVFLLVAGLANFLIGPLLGVLLALALLHYFAVSPGELEFSLRSVRDVKRSGRKLTFRAEHPRLGKTKKSVLRLESEKEALMLERALTAIPLAVAA